MFYAGGQDTKFIAHKAKCLAGMYQRIAEIYRGDSQMKLTPNHLEVLLHYHDSAEDHPRFHATAVTDAIKFWCAKGMLECNNDLEIKSSYKLTKKGEYWLDYILSVPLPTIAYKIEWEIPF